jgi:hypothetical protein
VNGVFMVIAQSLQRADDAVGRGCSPYSIIPVTESSSQETVTWANGSAVACAYAGRDGALELRSISFSVPQGGHFVDVLANYSGPDFAASRRTVDGVLASLVIH